MTTMTGEAPTAFVHGDGCSGPPLRVKEGKYGVLFRTCPNCHRSLRVRSASDMPTQRVQEPGRAWLDPTPADVDWPALVALCEARRIPVLRVDEHGELYLIRTTAQLRAEWKD